MGVGKNSISLSLSSSIKNNNIFDCFAPHHLTPSQAHTHTHTHSHTHTHTHTPGAREGQGLGRVGDVGGVQHEAHEEIDGACGLLLLLIIII